MNPIKRLPRTIRNAYIDFSVVGAFLGGRIRSNYKHLGATAVSNTEYVQLPHLFRDSVRADDIIVDVGCGKGRVFAWLIHRGYRNRMIGVEIEEAVAARTKKLFRRHANVEIRNCNILGNIPREGSLFFLYNPFENDVAARFKEEIEKTFVPMGKRVRVIYHYSAAIDMFKGDPLWDVEPLAFNPTGSALLTLKPDTAHPRK
jgi:SAM-dependent methyltransferase